MLENKNNVRKIRNIIIVLIAMIMLFGIFIKLIYPKREIQSIAAKELQKMKAVETIEVSNGTLDPIYRAEWTKVSSSLDKSSGTMQVVVNGSAKAVKNREGTVLTGIEYLSDVMSSLTSDDINVYIDGELAEEIRVAVSEVTELTGEDTGTGKVEVQYTITLSNFEVAIRKTGKNFKEWSGNVALQIAKGTLQDMYGSRIDTDGNLVHIAGNSNLAEIELNTDGETENIVVKEETQQTANSATTEANMFIDLIKPEFTYTYAEGDIDYDHKKVKVTFDVADKYFNSTSLATDTNADLITVLVDRKLPGDTNGNKVIDAGETLAIKKTLTKTAIYVMNTETKVVTSKETDYTLQENERKVGERYELIIEDLQQNPNDSFNFSGIITLGFGADIVSDLSGNKNNATTITIGLGYAGEEDRDTIIQSTQYTNAYLPEGYSFIEGTLDTGIVIADPKGNEYVWVEVPMSSEVYQTAGLDITEFDDEDYERIENDLNTYTAKYKSDSTFSDTYYSETGMTLEEYNYQKKTMLKSIYKNGGFYVGRYETGYETDSSEVPAIKQNLTPYTGVTMEQAQILADSFTSSLSNYSSSLMFGVQWDLILKYIQDKENLTDEEIMTDSSSWGNGGTYTTIKTGSNETYKKQNIYDLAGNILELTLECGSSTRYVIRGGYIYDNSGVTYTASIAGRRISYNATRFCRVTCSTI